MIKILAEMVGVILALNALMNSAIAAMIFIIYSGITLFSPKISYTCELNRQKEE
jgi:hypothetical protein